MTEPHQGAVSAKVNARYDADGSEYTQTLLPMTHRIYPKPGRHPGQFIISCTRPHMESLRDYGDWRLSITPIDGGVQKSEDLYMNLAPLDGYQPSIEIDMIEGSDDYRNSIRNQRYYFVANDSAHYGSIRFDVEPFGDHSREACIIYANYRINPTGSRNSELINKTP